MAPITSKGYDNYQQTLVSNYSSVHSEASQSIPWITQHHPVNPQDSRKIMKRWEFSCQEYRRIAFLSQF